MSLLNHPCCSFTPDRSSWRNSLFFFYTQFGFRIRMLKQMSFCFVFFFISILIQMQGCLQRGLFKSPRWLDRGCSYPFAWYVVILSWHATYRCAFLGNSCETFVFWRQYFTFLPVIFHLLFLHVVSLIVFVFCFFCIVSDASGIWM